ncbi:MAG: SMI1/KNR4 family protein [Butyrivibrio sp.]|nr:SMI1/KNR4 family protein [Butyrivibrio sp.]
MYCTSMQFRLLNESELVSLERRGRIKFPKPYRDFMKTYGVGTYGGAICISAPDFDILQDSEECGFWQYEGAPITQEQFSECVVIGNSIDGDYIALHALIDGYILLPRGSDIIQLFPYDEAFICTINRIGNFLYEDSLEDYFEPVGSSYLFLRAAYGTPQILAERFQAAFGSDYLIENEYACEVFLIHMGGYVRFNLAYGFEVAVFYSDYGVECFERVKEFLHENGCV